MNKISTAVPGSLDATNVALGTTRDRARIAGVYAPTVTAFASDGSVDLEGGGGRRFAEDRASLRLVHNKKWISEFSEAYPPS
jgi:hypothetical protein